MKLYRHLAWDGIRKNSRLYVPYLLTGVGAVSFFYILVALSRLPEGTLPGSGSVQVILNLGSFVLWVFSLLLLFYTHSFLIRRRNREFALYNVLGMGKRDIARILCWETLLSGGISLAGGLALGILLSKLAELGLLRMVGAATDMVYRVSAGGLLLTLGLYGAIYLLILISSLVRVGRSTAVQLMRSQAEGEKPPRANWALAVLGILLLAGAYYLAVTIREPLAALTWFFAAVLMVIAATYLLFISGSVALCRLLQKNPRFYYQKRHFVSVSSLVYRMKRNGAGLASICILSTMVLVMLASTASLYFGAEDAISTLAVQNQWHPNDIAEIRTEFFSLYGSLFFLGILLSVLFLFATLLMLYYKQVVEGYEDASRFAIMQRVGMTKRDIRESVNAQMLLIFLLPLGAATLHLAFAQPMVWQILQLFGIQNLTLFLGVTGAALLLFTLLYCAMYRLTSNAYFRIVSTQNV